jgi:anti-sigma factor RsiW
MTVDNTPVTPDELHAFVDGELPADRQQAVNEWLASHPDDAALVAAWRAQADAIRTQYGAVINEKVPDRLSIENVLRNGGRSWRSIATAAAVAAIMAFSVGGVAGWMARGASASAPSDVESFSNDALAAHRLYIGEVRHPIEVGATEAHLLPWLSRRIGTNLRAPELDKFDLKLLGGRLLPGMHSPAALFMYESASGERVTLYCSKLNTERTGFRYNANDQFAAVQWIEGGYGYVVSGPAEKMRLKQIARSAYEQLENRAPPPPQNKATFLDQLMSRRGS